MLNKLSIRLQNIYVGWWMVAIGSAVRVLGGGLHYYGSTLFFLPVSQQLGLSRAATSVVFSLSRAQGALEGPLAGYIIDRHGPRPVMLAAMLFTGVGYMALSGVHSFTALLLVYIGLISLSYQAGVMDATMAIPASWIVHKRSMAMAWMSASIGLGGMLVTPLLAYAVHAWGWRYGALAAGITFVVVGIPIARRRRVQRYGKIYACGHLRDGSTRRLYAQANPRYLAILAAARGDDASSFLRQHHRRPLHTDHDVERAHATPSRCAVERRRLSRPPGAHDRWISRRPLQSFARPGDLHVGFACRRATLDSCAP